MPNDIRVTGLDHVMLNVADVERSLAFDVDCVVGGPDVRFGAPGHRTSLPVQDPDGNTVELRCC